MEASSLTPTFEMNLPLQVLDWGLIDYKKSLEQQLELVEKVASSPSHPGYIIFCTHPPVVTLGRQTQPNDVTTWTGETVEISRGGRATYHGPSQLVVYVIMNIKNPRKHRGPQEIRGFLRDFESAIAETLNIFNLNTFGRSTENIDDTGVWLNTENGIQKITSIGIAVKKWVTYHGAAINLTYDSEAFSGINPCGYDTKKMISLEELLQKRTDPAIFKTKLIDQLQKFL